MDMKLVILACVLSFIIGTNTVIMWNKVREVKEDTKPRGCSVTYMKGGETHVWIGEYVNELIGENK